MISKTELALKRFHPVAFNANSQVDKARSQPLHPESSGFGFYNLRVSGHSLVISLVIKTDLWERRVIVRSHFWEIIMFSQLGKHQTLSINILASLDLRRKAATLPGCLNSAIDMKLVQATCDMWPASTNRPWSSRCRKKVSSSFRFISICTWIILVFLLQ